MRRSLRRRDRRRARRSSGVDRRWRLRRLGGGSPPAPDAAGRHRRRPQALGAGQQVTIRYCNNQKARITEPTAVARARPRRRLRPRRLLGLGGLRHRRLHHQQHRAGAGRPRLRGGQPRLPAGPARPLAGPDRRREVRHPLPAGQRPPLPHRPHRDRRLGPERRRAPRGAPRHRAALGRLGHRRLRQRVERGAGGGRHGRAERPADHGRPGRRRARSPRASSRSSATCRASSSAPTCKKASPITYVSDGRPALPHPRLEQRRDRLPRAVGGAGLGPRRWPACPASW